MKIEQALLMSDYNQWMNERLYDVCAQLTDAQRKQDKSAFFKSIHGTLNHSLLGDKVWLGRFVGKVFEVKGLDEMLYDNYEALSVERKVMDDRITKWVSSLTHEELNAPFNFKSIVNPSERTCDLSVAVMHFFNHQTHHRGQVTTLLSQYGKDMGVTDLLGMPGAVKQL